MTTHLAVSLTQEARQMPVWVQGQLPAERAELILAKECACTAVTQAEKARDIAGSRRQTSLYDAINCRGAMIRIGNNGTKFYWVRARKVISRYPFEPFTTSIDPEQVSNRIQKLVHAAENYFVGGLQR